MDKYIIIPKKGKQISQQYNQLFQHIIYILAFNISVDLMTKQKYQRVKPLKCLC